MNANHIVGIIPTLKVNNRNLNEVFYTETLGMKEIFPVDTFKELILTEFEGRMLPVPKKYDQFLTQMYGDYMTPPSKEMQEWYSHSIKAYRKS